MEVFISTASRRDGVSELSLWLHYGTAKTPISTRRVRLIIARAGELAGTFPPHPQRLRHGCGYSEGGSGKTLKTDTMSSVGTGIHC